MTVRHTDDLCIATHRREPSRPRLALDGLYLCQGCLSQLTHNLDQLPGLYAELAEMLAVGGQAGQRVSGSPGRPLPINLGVAEHRGHIQAVLSSWCRLVVDERGLELPDSDEVAITAPWLARHVLWLAAAREFADDVVREIRQLAMRARGLRDPDPSRNISIGPCVATTEDGPCAGQVWATVRVDGDERPSVIFCDTCEFEKAPEEWLRFGREYARKMSDLPGTISVPAVR